MSSFKTVKAAIFLAVLFTLLNFNLALAADRTNPDGYLGVMLQSLDSSLAQAMDLEDSDGVLVSEVVSGGPADEAGLEDGDVIIEFNGRAINSTRALTKVVGATTPGESIAVVILREGKKKTIDVEIGERGSHDLAFYRNFDAGDNDYFVWHNDDGEDAELLLQKMTGQWNDRGFMGVELDDLNEQMGDYFGVKDGNGALITSVTEDSAAQKAGLKAGDVIVKMGDEDIESAGDVHSALKETKPEDELRIKVVRKGKNKKLDITLGEAPQSTFHTPKILFHGNSDADFRFPKMMHRELRSFHEEKLDLKEMRSDLEELKIELEKMKAELKK